jgi:hypothetical protein
VCCCYRFEVDWPSIIYRVFSAQGRGCRSTTFHKFNCRSTAHIPPDHCDELLPSRWSLRASSTSWKAQAGDSFLPLFLSEGNSEEEALFESAKHVSFIFNTQNEGDAWTMMSQMKIYNTVQVYPF